jgi:SAM-dependent methyltransferase
MITPANVRSEELRFNLELFARNCPICGTNSNAVEFAPANFDLSRLDTFAFASRKRPEFMHYRLVECRTCDVLYANPAPSPDALVNAYAGASFNASNESEYAAKTYGNYLGRYLPDMPDRNGALDIGTGDGAFLDQLQAAGFENVVGVEPSAAPVQAAKPHLRALIRLGQFQASDYASEQFRLVSCFQTIEHVHDPLQLCRDALRIIKPGGALFIVCHNRRALVARLLGQKSPIFDIEHLQLFSRASVRALLKTAGFERVEVQPIVNCYPVSYWANLLPAPPLVKDLLSSILTSTRAGKLTLAAPAGNLAAIAFR